MNIRSIQHRLGPIAALFALTLSASGCGQDDPDANPGTAQQTEPLEFLQFSQGGSACMGDCSRSFGVKAPNILVLEDAEGRIELTIAPEDVASVLQLSQTTDFAEAVAQAQAGDRCNGADMNIALRYQRPGQLEQGPLGVDGCAAQSGNPMAEAFTQLQTLMKANLQCPTWQEPQGFDMATDPLPQRALCYFCYGNCQELPQ